MEFGERTRDSSPGHTGREGPQLAMTGASCGFSRVGAQVEFSHEVQRGSQGASHVVPEKSGVYACDEGEPINALESW